MYSLGLSYRLWFCDVTWTCWFLSLVVYQIWESILPLFSRILLCFCCCPHLVQFHQEWRSGRSVLPKLNAEFWLERWGGGGGTDSNLVETKQACKCDFWLRVLPSFSASYLSYHWEYEMVQVSWESGALTTRQDKGVHMVSASLGGLGLCRQARFWGA